MLIFWRTVDGFWAYTVQSIIGTVLNERLEVTGCIHDGVGGVSTWEQ